MKHLVQYLAHSRTSMNVFPCEVKVTVSLSLTCHICKVYPIGLSVFLLGEMKSWSNSNIKLVKKFWPLLLFQSSFPSQWNEYGSNLPFFSSTECFHNSVYVGSNNVLEVRALCKLLLGVLRTGLWFGKQSIASVFLEQRFMRVRHL